MPEKLRQLVGRGGQIDFVAGFQNKVAGRNNRLVFPRHGADKHANPRVPVEFKQADSVERGVFRQTVLD